MAKDAKEPDLSESILEYREALHSLREIIFANIVMAGEVPAPTGEEFQLTRFLRDRFTESMLNDISLDQQGNVAGVLSGQGSQRNLLVAAHVDKIWSAADDHTVSVGVGQMTGRGLADNGLGVAVLASLPGILQSLDISLQSNLILLGTTKSFGRGDLGGMRFFLENGNRQIDAALCVEGMDLGRLSFSSLGMARGVITIDVSGETGGIDRASSGVITFLNRIAAELADLNWKEHPDLRILIGSIEAGSGYNVPPLTGKLRFEIRSENAKRVSEIESKVQELVTALNLDEEVTAGVEMIAHRQPGRLSADHPLVMSARDALETLGVQATEEPSVSELAALLDRGIPALTLGITQGGLRHSAQETIQLDPIFDGLAQLVAVLQFMDTGNFTFEG